jgi:hypothetical protein
MLNRVRVIDSLSYIPDTQHGINSSAGILFNTPKLYIGYTVSLLRRTIGDSRFNPVNMLPRDWFYSNLQAGYTFQKNSKSVFSFTPQIVIGIEKNPYSPRIIVGLRAYNANFRYKQFIWGINDAGLDLYIKGRDIKNLPELGGIHIGWQTDKFRVMLTNSYSRNRSYEEFQYAGNLSLRYVLGNSSKPGRSW